MDWASFNLHGDGQRQKTHGDFQLWSSPVELCARIPWEPELCMGQNSTLCMRFFGPCLAWRSQAQTGFHPRINSTAHGKWKLVHQVGESPPFELSLFTIIHSTQMSSVLPHSYAPWNLKFVIRFFSAAKEVVYFSLLTSLRASSLDHGGSINSGDFWWFNPWVSNKDSSLCFVSSSACCETAGRAAATPSDTTGSMWASEADCAILGVDFESMHRWGKWDCTNINVAGDSALGYACFVAGPFSKAMQLRLDCQGKKGNIGFKVATSSEESQPMLWLWWNVRMWIYMNILNKKADLNQLQFWNLLFCGQ